MRDWKAILDYVCEQYVQRNFNEGNTEWMPERWRNQKDLDLLMLKLRYEFGVDLPEGAAPHSVEKTMEQYSSCVEDEYTEQDCIEEQVKESFFEELGESTGEDGGLTDLYTGASIGMPYGTDKEQDKGVNVRIGKVVDWLVDGVIEVIQLQDLKEE